VGNNMFFINDKNTKEFIANLENKVAEILEVDEVILSIHTADNSEVLYGIEFVFNTNEDNTYSCLTIMDNDFHLVDVLKDYELNDLVQWYKDGERFYINNVRKLEHYEKEN
jgi:hypothetical protein